jgi:YVTN family beta-propeller protein
MRTGCRVLAACAGSVVLGVGAAAAVSAGATAGDPWLVYVADTGSNSVSVIDTATHAVVATIPVGDRPAAVSVSPDSTAARVANADGTVSVIDTFTNAVARTETAAAGGGTQSMATTPDGATSYRVDTAQDRVDVVETATGRVVATISGVGDGPCAVAISPDGASAYVANVGSGTVAIIDTASNSVTEIVAVGRQPSAVAITPDQPPTAALAVAPAAAGQPTTLDASDSTVRFGTIAAYAWDFGDGTTATTTVPSTTHVFGSAGRHPVSLTLTSSGGTSTTHVFSGRALIRNGGPQARLVRTVVVDGLPITGAAARAAALLGLLMVAVGAGLVLLGDLVTGRRAVPARRRSGR